MGWPSVTHQGLDGKVVGSNYMYSVGCVLEQDTLIPYSFDQCPSQHDLQISIFRKSVKVFIVCCYSILSVTVSTHVGGACGPAFLHCKYM